MARQRSELSEKLHEICQNVYFQPPANIKLTYPCIIYRLDNLNVRFADNGGYQVMDEYSLTYITRDPDDELIRIIPLTFPYCVMTNTATSDNLRNYYYRLYF